MISAERAKEIAMTYYEDIYHLCYLRLRKEADAHDVAQEIFLFFQEHCENLDDEYIKAWLISVADKKIKEKFRDIANREKELIFGTVFGSAKSTELVYELEQDFSVSDDEIEEKKKSILSQLTEKELELFEMVYVKHMKYEELAKSMGVSEHAMRTRVYRLKNKIKERVSFAFMALLLLIMKL